MKFSYLFTVFGFLPKQPTNIRNGDYPLCKECIYYRPSLFDLISGEKFGRCTKYGTKEVVAGFISYEYADLCRKNEEKCGLKGKDFFAKPNLLDLMDETGEYFYEKIIDAVYDTLYQNDEYCDELVDKKYCGKKCASSSLNGGGKEGENGKEGKEGKDGKIESFHCTSEEEDCYTEYCNECISKDCVKKSTMMLALCNWQ